MNVKQDLNIYTVMLLTAFVALLIGCIALAIEMGRYPSPTPWRSGDQRVSAMRAEPIGSPAALPRISDIDVASQAV
jgi:hypothetical protein